MDENQESNQNENGWAGARADANRSLVVAVVALLVMTAVTFAYGYHQQSRVRQLSEQSSTANATMKQLQGQVAALTARLNEMTAAQTPPPSVSAVASSAAEPDTETSAQTSEAPFDPAVSAKAAPAPALPKRPTAKRHAPVDKKYAQLQAQLAQQEEQLKATQNEVAKNRADLEGTIGSTRDDLNGSIAKTHEELVAMEKRGERSYFEFDLSKSKQFQRIGPITLSLRKADAKHKSYDLAMIVDDDELNKKKVNLYEPIWIHTETDSQPVQIIVNKIDKDTVHGYISAPKYKPSELAAGGSASVAPVSAKTPASTVNTPSPQQPQR